MIHISQKFNTKSVLAMIRSLSHNSWGCSNRTPADGHTSE